MKKEAEIRVPIRGVPFPAQKFVDTIKESGSKVLRLSGGKELGRDVTR